MTFVYRYWSFERSEEEEREGIKSSRKCPLNTANFFIFFMSLDSIPGIFLSN